MGMKLYDRPPKRPVRGFLLLGDTFRVYDDPEDPDKGFTDYQLLHSDLEVEIIGEHDFWEDEDGDLYLDHSAEALGRER